MVETPSVAAAAEPYGELAPELRSEPELARFFAEGARRRVQVLVATPDDTSGSVDRRGFRVDAEYFYPASAVKLCAAVGAVEKLAEMRRARAPLTLDSPLRVSFAGDRSRVVDTTLRDELEKALVVSDNDAFNLLFDFVGAEELAARMSSLGVQSARIAHRLGDAGDDAVPAFELRAGTQSIAVAQRVGVELSPTRSAFVGTAHVDTDGRRIDAPFDFGEKNAITLRDLQDLLVAVVRPDLSELRRPRWTEEDREALVTILGRLPSQLPGRPSRSLDEVHKPLLSAVSAVLPGHDVRVFGKGGRAYGFTVENAWIVDATTKRSVFVAATIYANDNETINDDNYEYETVAEPFVGHLGRAVARAFLR